MERIEIEVYTEKIHGRNHEYLQLFLVANRNSIRGCVRPPVRPSVGPWVRNLFFRRAETKTANDLFRVYELVDT